MNDNWKQRYEILKKEHIDTITRNEEKQQRIDKAIEYIKESCVYDEDDGFEEKIYSLNVPTLLEILGEKENE